MYQEFLKELFDAVIVGQAIITYSDGVTTKWKANYLGEVSEEYTTTASDSNEEITAAIRILEGTYYY